MHDVDSKLRVRPVPTSQRKERAIDSTYSYTSLYDLLATFGREVEEIAGETSMRKITHKYEDLTDEERRELAREKHKKRYKRLFRMRFI